MELLGDDETTQNLCLDKGYAGQLTQDCAAERGYRAHVPDKANAKQKRKRNLDDAKRGVGLSKLRVLG